MKKVANHMRKKDAYHRYRPEPFEEKFEGGADSDASEEEPLNQEMTMKNVSTEGTLAEIIRKA